MLKPFSLILVLYLICLILAGCGDNNEKATATPFGSGQVGAPTAIPTFTAIPATPVPAPTITPTPIVVPPSATPAPTITPVPTPTATFAPTSTPFPTQAPRPTATVATVTGQGTYRQITEEQARNLDGYRALLPTYLPEGYKLARISYSEITGTNIISLIAEFDNDKTQSFYLNTQYVPGLAPLPTAKPSPSLSPSPYTPLPSPTPPPLKVGPFPTVGPGEFKQDTVLVRGQAGLLSYSSQFTSLSWTETTSSYALNGVITPDEALAIAASLR